MIQKADGHITNTTANIRISSFIGTQQNASETSLINISSEFKQVQINWDQTSNLVKNFQKDMKITLEIELTDSIAIYFNDIYFT